MQWKGHMYTRKLSFRFFFAPLYIGMYVNFHKRSLIFRESNLFWQKGIVEIREAVHWSNGENINHWFDCDFNLIENCYMKMVLCICSFVCWNVQRKAIENIWKLHLHLHSACISSIFFPSSLVHKRKEN